MIPEFKENLCNYSIICLCETKLDDIDNEDISNQLDNLGFSVYFKNRKPISNYRSGGLCLIIKKALQDFVSIVESESKLVQWFKIDKTLTGYDKDVIVGNVYIPPVRTRYEHDVPLVEIQDEMVNFAIDNLICLTGDFNAHTKTTRDFIVGNEFIMNQLEFDSEISAMLDDLGTLNVLGIQLNRNNQDIQNVNSYGTSLLKFCKAHNLIIANGRVGNDRNGNYTTSENSVIDYVIGNPEIISYIHSFNVKPFDAIYSDKHCRIVWSLKCGHMNDSENANCNNKVKVTKTHKQMWSEDSSPLFNDNISNENLNQIMQDLNNKSIPINICVSNIEKLFYDAANATFGPEYTVELNSKRSRKLKFSNETLAKKNAYKLAKKLAKKENKDRERDDVTMNNVVNASGITSMLSDVKKLKRLVSEIKDLGVKILKIGNIFGQC